MTVGVSWSQPAYLPLPLCHHHYHRYHHNCHQYCHHVHHNCHHIIIIFFTPSSIALLELLPKIMEKIERKKLAFGFVVCLFLLNMHCDDHMTRGMYQCTSSGVQSLTGYQYCSRRPEIFLQVPVPSGLENPSTGAASGCTFDLIT